MAQLHIKHMRQLLLIVDQTKCVKNKYQITLDVANVFFVQSTNELSAGEPSVMGQGVAPDTSPSDCHFRQKSDPLILSMILLLATV